MKIKAKKIRIEFNNSSGDYWEASCEIGLEFDEAIRMITRAWEEHDASAEPLIKDEKIRKAVRVWADGNNIESVHYDAFWRGFRRKNSSITVWEELPLEDNEVYTIAELCGEEEE